MLFRSLEQVRDTAERKDNAKRNDNKKNDDDEGFDPGSADRASQELVREVSETAEELKDGLTDR